MSDKQVERALREVGLPVKPCGLNADWCVSAWHLSNGTPNQKDGDYYLLDTEETNDDGDCLFEIVTRFYATDDDLTDNDVVRCTFGPKPLGVIVEHLRSLAFYAPKTLAFHPVKDIDTRPDPNDCAECARSFGPWYTGECEH